jgi:hypothetical protein
MATIAGLKGMRAVPPQAFDLIARLSAFVRMETVTDAVRLLGLLLAGAVGGLFTAAVLAARRGAPR